MSPQPQGISADLALVTGLKSGDQGSMAELYDRYSSVVYAVALRVLGDTGAAEDVLQEVFQIGRASCRERVFAVV